MLTLSPRLSSRHPIEAAAKPLPNEDTTPPVTKMYFADIASSLYFVLGNCAAWGARSIMTEKHEEGNVEKEAVIAGARASSCVQVIEQAGEHAVEPRIPLLPFVSARNDVKFVREVPLPENLGEIAIGRKQPFLVAAGEKKVGHLRRINRPGQHKRIAFAPACTVHRAENRTIVTVLPDARDRERTAGRIEGGTEAASERVQVGMAKGKFDGAKTSHRHAHDGTVRASRSRCKPGFHVDDEIVSDVILITISRTFGGVGVPGLIAVGHDQD